MCNVFMHIILIKKKEKEKKKRKYSIYNFFFANSGFVTFITLWLPNFMEKNQKKMIS